MAGPAGARRDPVRPARRAGSSSTAYLRTGRGLDRLVTFVDAIVAIAITLLVLPLVDLAGEVTGTTGHPPVVPEGQIAVFLLSFFVISRLWISHHALFEHVHAYDAALLWWTLAWALTIVFLPYPTELVADRGSEVAVHVLYIGTMTLSSGCLTVLTVLVSRRPELRGDDHRRPVPADLAIISTACFLVAFVVGVTIHPIGYYALLVLLLQNWLTRVWRRHGRRQRPAGPARTPGAGPSGSGSQPAHRVAAADDGGLQGADPVDVDRDDVAVGEAEGQFRDE